MTARDHLLALLGPDAVVEADACVAAAPPLPENARTELVAVAAAELAAPEPQVA